MIIIPDTHGRTFWKDAIKEKQDNEKVIFLGDYHDPYPHENISTEDSIVNFEEILDYKKNNPKDVILLLGNHDCGYIWPDVCSSRRDRVHYKDISAMFRDNFDKFDLAYQKDGYLLTHAGVHKWWFDLVDSHIKDIDYNHVADILNNWLHVDEYDKESMLGIYSNYRGWGGDLYGSCVWADVREWLAEPINDTFDDKKLPFYQIFSHTQLVEEPLIQPDWACLDTRNGYRLDGDTLTNFSNKQDYILK